MFPQSGTRIKENETKNLCKPYLLDETSSAHEDISSRDPCEVNHGRIPCVSAICKKNRVLQRCHVRRTSKQRFKTARRFHNNVTKNWALAIMLTASAYFSSEPSLNEEMIIPVRKRETMLVIFTQN